MKPTFLAAILFLVTLGVALWLLGVFETPPATAPEAPTPLAPGTPAGAPPDLATGEPKEMPPPQVPALARPVRVLILGETPRSFTMWLPMLWRLDPQVVWQAWFAERPDAGTATHSDALPPLEGQPTVKDLDEVRVLVLAGIDPSRFPGSFWGQVADRVRAKTLGLLVLAEHRFAKATADEPSLTTVIPVAAAKAVAPVAPGSSIIAGVYETPRPFAVTEAGRRHPASRIVPYPDWSEKHWLAQQKGDGEWTTKFCAPVEGAAPGGSVLVELDTGEGRVPALVASGEGAGRVLWLGGFFDLERPAYVGKLSYERGRALGVSWVAWLAGL